MSTDHDQVVRKVGEVVELTTDRRELAAIVGQATELTYASEVVGNFSLPLVAAEAFDMLDAPPVIHAPIDTPVPYRVEDLINLLDERMGKLENRAQRVTIHRLMSRIQTFRNHPRYAFMFEDANIGGDTMADVLSPLFRLPPNGTPMTIMPRMTVSKLSFTIIGTQCSGPTGPVNYLLNGKPIGSEALAPAIDVAVAAVELGADLATQQILVRVAQSAKIHHLDGGIGRVDAVQRVACSEILHYTRQRIDLDEVRDAVAIGNEINRIVDPNRIYIFRVRPGRRALGPVLLRRG